LETDEIQNGVRVLDSEVGSLWNQILSLQNRVNDYYSRAEQYDNMYYSIINSITYGEDDCSNRITQAERYAESATDCRNMASQCENEILSLKNDLRAYRPQYEYYMNACGINIANLNIAVDKLMNIAGQKYGGSATTALNAAKQKLLLNRQFADGCQSRINSIDQICGSAGDVQSKVLRLR